MSHRLIQPEAVARTPAIAFAPDEASRLEVAQNAQNGPFGDPDSPGKISYPKRRVAGNADQDVRVVGQKRPGTLVFSDMHNMIILTDKGPAGSL